MQESEDDADIDQWLQSFVTPEDVITGPLPEDEIAQVSEAVPPRKKRLRADRPSDNQALELAPFVDKDADELYASAQVIPVMLDSASSWSFRLKVVFAAFDTKCTLDLRQIATRARNVEYNSKKQVRACFIRLRNPPVTGSVYEKGRVAVIGSNSLADAKLGAKKMARLIQRAGHPNVIFANYRVENLTGGFDLGFPVRLEAMATSHRSTCTYEPELAPSLFYRMPDCKVTLQVWASGKVLLTGAKTLAEMQHALCVVMPLAATFQT